MASNRPPRPHQAQSDGPITRAQSASASLRESLRGTGDSQVAAGAATTGLRAASRGPADRGTDPALPPSDTTLRASHVPTGAASAPVNSNRTTVDEVQEPEAARAQVLGDRAYPPSVMAVLNADNAPSYLVPLLQFFQDSVAALQARITELEKDKQEDVLRSTVDEVFNRLIGTESYLCELSNGQRTMVRTVVTHSSDPDTPKKRIAHPTPDRADLADPRPSMPPAHGMPTAPPSALRAPPVTHHTQAAVPNPIPSLPLSFAHLPTIGDHGGADAARQLPRDLRPPLITTAESLAPLPVTPTADIPPDLGPFAPGLEPMTTMLSPFEVVIDYHHYRLTNLPATLTPDELRHTYRAKRNLDSLMPAISVYDGTIGIDLLQFLSSFKEGMDTLQQSQATAVRVLAFFLHGDDKDTYQAQVSPGT